LKRENDILVDVNQALELTGDFHVERNKRRTLDMSEINKLKGDCQALHSLQDENERICKEVSFLRQERENIIHIEEENSLLKRQLDDRNCEREIAQRTDEECRLKIEEEIVFLEQQLKEKEETEGTNLIVQKQLENKILDVTRLITESRREIVYNGEELEQLRSENFSLWQELEKTRQHSSESVAKTEVLKYEMKELETVRNENKTLKSSLDESKQNSSTCRAELEFLLVKSDKMRIDIHELDTLREEVKELKEHLDSTMDAFGIQSEEIDFLKEENDSLRQALEAEKKDKKARECINRPKTINFPRKTETPESSPSMSKSSSFNDFFVPTESAEIKEKNSKNQIHSLWDEIEQLKHDKSHDSDERKQTATRSGIRRSRSDSYKKGRRTLNHSSFSSSMSARELIKKAEKVGRSLSIPNLNGRTVMFDKKHSFLFDDEYYPDF